jgi:hypothetical protein
MSIHACRLCGGMTGLEYCVQCDAAASHRGLASAIRPGNAGPVPRCLLPWIVQTIACWTEGQWTLQDFELDEERLQVRMLADDVAGVAYKVTERLLVEGQALALEANDASIWVRENGEWKCAIHTQTLAGDPFGRDRKA